MTKVESEEGGNEKLNESVGYRDMGIADMAALVFVAPKKGLDPNECEGIEEIMAVFSESRPLI